MDSPRKAFGFEVDFISGIDPIEAIDQDLQYIAEKVSVYRSVHLRELDPVDNRYLDSLLTMVDLLKYAIAASKGRFHPTLCRVSTDIGAGASMICEGRLVTDHVGGIQDYTTSTPIAISQNFMMEGVVGHPWGVFSFDMYNDGITPIRDSNGGVLVPTILFQFGNCLMKHAMSGFVEAANEATEFLINISEWEDLDHADPDQFICTLVNQNDALRYCENFPAPSIVMNMIKNGYDAIEDRLLKTCKERFSGNNATMQGGNEHNEETHGEWPGGPEAEVSEEG